MLERRLVLSSECFTIKAQSSLYSTYSRTDSTLEEGETPESLFSMSNSKAHNLL